jgi:mannose-6-phosphate isomerase-like protein (cupin superfamily)
MYGKTFKEINTKKIIKYKLNKSYVISQLFDEIDYSLFKLVLVNDVSVSINEKNYLLITEISNDKISSSYIKMNKIMLNKSISKIYYLCFQKKKTSLKIKTTKTITKHKILKFKSLYKKNNLLKYWGDMATILKNKNGSVKVINMLKNKQSSMEFHINKKESYYICSGKLKLGLRYSRAKQRSLILNRGNSFLMKPGTMHMRLSIQDTFILEMSTKDEDNDSIIVEDGLKYKFNEIR